MIPTTFSRRDNSVLGRWWWTVDRLALSLLLILIAIGVFLSFAASPSVAERLNLGTFYFVKRHMIMLIPALITMISVSLLSPVGVRRLSLLIYLLGIILPGEKQAALSGKEITLELPINTDESL